MQKPLLTLILLCLLRLSAFAQGTDYPVYSSPGPPPAGIYLAADDYLSLRPSDTEIVFQHIAQLEGDGINNFFRKKTSGKKGERIDPKDCFAASDGKTFYIAHAGKWHKARKADGEYSFIALQSRITKEEADRIRLGGISRTRASGGSGDVLIPAEFMEDPYLMKFSLPERKWVAIERVGKRRK